MMIEQGEVYFADFGEPAGSGPGFRRPYVIVQNDVFNASRISTVVGCLITSNLKRGSDPGNVVLEIGEANLTKKSVVNVSQILTMDKDFLDERVGALSPRKLREVLEGVFQLIEPRSVEGLF